MTDTVRNHYTTSPNLAYLATKSRAGSSAILQMLRSDGIIHNDKVLATPLRGGVASDVFLIQDGDRQFVAKQALPRMKVQDLWEVDVSRNRTEYEYLSYVGRILPGSVPAVFDLGDGYFTMEYLDEGFRNWKQMLLAGDCRIQHAAQAGTTLGIIHRMSAGDMELERRFDTTKTFHQCRTDPYLLTTGLRHPELKEYFENEALRLEGTRECLVHGDYSPKNILVADDRQVLLDCEVAWYGDAAFDLAFLLSHLLLKSLYHTPDNVGLYSLVEQVIRSYYMERNLPHDKREDFEHRVARLLPLLLLARIDGKSPAEYICSEEKKEFVRRFVTSVLPIRDSAILTLVARWFEAHSSYN